MKKELLKLKKNLLITSLVLGSAFGGISAGNNVCYASEISKETETESNKPITIDDTIEYYSKVFSLDSDKIHEKLYSMTNNFNDYGWKYAYAIDGNIYDSS